MREASEVNTKQKADLFFVVSQEDIGLHVFLYYF